MAPPHLVRGVIDEDGKDRWPSPVPPSTHASARAAFLATRLLERVVSDGTGRRAAKWGLQTAWEARPVPPTTHGTRGLPGLPTSWPWLFGCFDKSGDLGLTGSKAALPTWSRFVADTGQRVERFSPPDGVVEMTFCPDDHQPAGDPVVCEDAYTEYVSASAPPMVPKRQADGTVVLEEPGLIGQAWDRITSDTPEPTTPAEAPDSDGRKRWWRRSGG